MYIMVLYYNNTALKGIFMADYYTFSIKTCAIFFNCHTDTQRGSKLRQMQHLNKGKRANIKKLKKNCAYLLQGKKIFMYFGSNFEKSDKL